MHIPIFYCNFAAQNCLGMKKILFIALLLLANIATWAALPDVTLRDIDGHEINVASLAQTGKPVIISFFATWCKPCMRELKAVHDLYPDWHDDLGVEMYIVSVDQGQDAHKVKPLVDGNGWEYHVLLDPNGAFKRAMNVQSIPHMFILDRKGNIVYNHVGYTEGDEANISTYLK